MYRIGIVVDESEEELCGEYAVAFDGAIASDERGG